MYYYKTFRSRPPLADITFQLILFDLTLFSRCACQRKRVAMSRIQVATLKITSFNYTFNLNQLA